MSSFPNDDVTMNLGSIEWRVKKSHASSLARELLPGIQDLTPGPHVRRIKDNNVRTVHAVTDLPELPFVIVKRYKVPDVATRIKNRLEGTKAQQEWEGAHSLLQRGVPTCRPLALGQSRGKEDNSSYVVMEGLSNTVTVVSQLRKLAYREKEENAVTKKRTRLLKHLAAITRILLETGVYHRDYHTGNVLARYGNNGDLSLFMIDLHSVRCPFRFFRFLQRRLLAKLYLDLENFTSEAERRIFLRDCYDVSQVRYLSELQRMFNQITARTQRLERRRILSRTRRCVVRSTRYWHEKTSSGRIYHRRSVEADAVLAAIEKHHRVREDSNSPNILKTSVSGRTVVTKVPLAIKEDDARETIVCVKEHRPIRLKDRLLSVFRNRGMGEWYAISGFIVRGVETPEALALVEKKDGWLRTTSYVLTRFLVDHQELDQFLDHAFQPGGKCSDRSDRRLILKTVAHIMAYLHENNVYHPDFKASNALIALSPENRSAPHIALIDLTGVFLWRRVTRSRALKNLAQLDWSLPYSVSRADRLRFLLLYREARGITQDLRVHVGEIFIAGRNKINYWRKETPD